MARPGDETAAGAGGRHGRLRASHADREQVIDVLKAAFVQGCLTKDEFDLRVGQVLASRTYADLDVPPSDIPARLAAAQPPEPAREPNQPDKKKLIARGTAVGTGATMVLTAVAVMPRHPVVGLVAIPVVSCFAAMLLPGLPTFLSRVLDKGSSRQPVQGPPPSATSNPSQRLAPVGPAGQLPQISRAPRHTAEAARSRLARAVDCLQRLAWNCHRDGIRLRRWPITKIITRQARELARSPHV
ncbi:MAG TPA: DUF1707 domain-containing protein [Streptosporangiaceae bacterium]